MRYPTSLILKGSVRQDEIRRDSMEQKIKDLYAKRESVIEQWQSDLPAVEEIAEKLAKRLMQGEVCTQDELRTAFVRPRKPGSVSVLWYGLDKDEIDNLDNRIDHLEAELEATPKKSDFTLFLETIKDEEISDYGVKTAGWAVRLSDLAILGNSNA